MLFLVICPLSMRLTSDTPALFLLQAPQKHSCRDKLVPAPLHACAVALAGPVSLVPHNSPLRHAHTSLLLFILSFPPCLPASPVGLVLSPSPIHSGSGGCCLGPFGISVAVTATLAAPGVISASGSVGPGTRRALQARAIDPAPGGPRARRAFLPEVCLPPSGGVACNDRAWLASANTGLCLGRFMRVRGPPTL